MNKENNDLCKKSEKKTEYVWIYNFIYKRIFIGICFIVMLIINFTCFDNESIAYIIGIVIIIVFNFIWYIIEKKR